MKVLFASAAAAAAAFLITWALGFIVIPYFKKSNIRQNILSDTKHEKKQGTPTMGGVMFIAGIILSLVAVYTGFGAAGTDLVIIDCDRPADVVRTKLFAGFILAAGMGLIGIFDDMLKIKKGRNEGLTIIQKTALQLLIIFGFLMALDRAGASYTVVPYVHGNLIESRALFWIVGFIAIYCTVNAVNFTDGLDGLCSSVSCVMFVFFAVCGVLLGMKGLTVPCAAAAGALLGFIVWNANPAKIMMGDSGSLFLGGLICAMAYCLNAPWLIIPVCFIHVLEFASVVLQNVYALTHRGKRLFRMTPIHHHYQQGGWSENRVCAVFSAISVLCGISAVALIYFGINKLMK